MRLPSNNYSRASPSAPPREAALPAEGQGQGEGSVGGRVGELEESERAKTQGRCGAMQQWKAKNALNKRGGPATREFSKYEEMGVFLICQGPHTNMKWKKNCFDRTVCGATQYSQHSTTQTS